MERNSVLFRNEVPKPAIFIKPVLCLYGGNNPFYERKLENRSEPPYMQI